MRASTLVFFALFLLVNCLHAQGITELRADIFLDLVERNHPLARRAQLDVDKAEAGLLRARGAFDPQVFGSTNWKQLDDKEYYRMWEAGIQAPLWPGMSLEAGYENNTGGFINPEKSTVSNGLLFAGISIPILRGLTTDERRTAVKRARIEVVRSAELQQLRINDLLLDAANAYWSWWLTYQLRTVQQTTLALSYDRWQFTKNLFLLGDVAAIDTLEAYAQWQNRKVDLQRAEIQYIRASYRLSNFMWNEEGEPLFLNPGVVPQKAGEADFREEMISIALRESNIPVTIHPQLMNLNLQRDQQELDLRLRKEMLKPALNLKYNFLTTPNNDVGLSLRDYRWGAGLQVPLAYRRQRADIRLAKIAQLETDLQRDQQALFLETNRAALRETIGQVADNLSSFGSIASNFGTLLEAEQEKFNLGESTVFLVNARENQYLQSMQNWYHLHFELISQLNLWRWYQGDMKDAR
jgi:outer membrane protein TolC